MNRRKHEQYQLDTPIFDGYNKESSIQDALGSRRAKQRQESEGIRSTNFREGESGWRMTPSDILNVPLISIGILAPTTTPIKVGNMYVDTAANKVYIATGTASSSDWTALN